MRRGALAAVVVVVYLVCFGVEIALENLGKVDSIGYWYTALVAAVYSLAIITVFLIFYWLSKRLNRRITRSP